MKPVDLLSKIEDEVEALFLKLIAYEVSNQPVNNRELKQFFEEEKEKLYDYINSILSSSYYKKVDFDNILDSFVKTFIPKTAAKRAIIKLLFKSERYRRFSPDMLKVALEGFGIDYASFLNVLNETRFYLETLKQNFRIKGIISNLEQLVRFYLGSKNVSIFKTKLIVIDKNTNKFKLKAYKNYPQYQEFLYDIGFQFLMENTNTWWGDLADSITPSDLEYIEYDLPYVLINPVSNSASIYKMSRDAHEVLLKILNDVDANTYNYTLDLFGETFNVRQLVILYLFMFRLAYKHAFSINIPDTIKPVKNLFWWYQVDPEMYEPSEISILTYQLFSEFVGISPDISKELTFIIRRDLNLLKTYTPSMIVAHLISNYSGVLTSNDINKLNLAEAFIDRFTKQMDLYLSIIHYSRLKTILHSNIFIPQFDNIRTEVVESFYNNIEPQIHSEVRLSKIIYMLDDLLSNNLITLMDLLSIMVEIEDYILDYYNQKYPDVIDYLLPLYAIFGESLINDDKLRGFFEIIKPVHVKLINLSMIDLLNENDEEIIQILDINPKSGGQSFNPTSGGTPPNIDLTNRSCFDIYNSLQNIGELTDPIYSTNDVQLNYRTNYQLTQVNGYLIPHGLNATGFNGLQLDNGDRFDAWSEHDPTHPDISPIVSPGANSVYVGDTPFDNVQILEFNTTTNDVSIILSRKSITV